MGVPADATTDFSLPLQAGWNQIGDPFPTAEPFTSITVTSAASTQALPNAGNHVYNLLYTYPAGASGYTILNVLQGGTGLQPYAGYWIYAFQPVTLTYN